MSPARDLPKECLRCDWSGSMSGSVCPNCGATLFRPAQARLPSTADVRLGRDRAAARRRLLSHADPGRARRTR